MAELLASDTYWGTSYSNSLAYSSGEKLRLNIQEERAPYRSAQPTAQTADVWYWEKVFFEFQQMMARTQELSELDIPDIFTLRPISTQQIIVHITGIKPARFYYVPDMDDDDDDE